MKIQRRTAACLALACALGLGLACSPKRQIPQEKWLVVTSPAAPMLNELEDDDPPQVVLRAGEMVQITKEMRDFHWDATMDGKKDERKGMAVELKIAESGTHGYGFKSDLGAEASVPTTAWLCEEISGQGPFDKARCPGLLRRARTPDGALLVYETCSSGSCAVGVFKDDKLTVFPVENLISAWFYQGKTRSLFVVATRWVKDNGLQSGGAIVPIVIENGVAARKDDIAVDAVDVRDPKKMLSRLVHATVTSTEVTLAGEETVKDTDGTTLSTKPVSEKHPLPSLE